MMETQLTSEQTTIHRSFVGHTHSPNLYELFAAGYAVKCACGYEAKTYEEFWWHQHSVRDYYLTLQGGGLMETCPICCEGQVLFPEGHRRNQHPNSYCIDCGNLAIYAGLLWSDGCRCTVCSTRHQIEIAQTQFGERGNDV